MNKTTISFVALAACAALTPAASAQSSNDPLARADGEIREAVATSKRKALCSKAIAELDAISDETARSHYINSKTFLYRHLEEEAIDRNAILRAVYSAISEIKTGCAGGDFSIAYRFLEEIQQAPRFPEGDLVWDGILKYVSVARVAKRVNTASRYLLQAAGSQEKKQPSRAPGTCLGIRFDRMFSDWGPMISD